MHELVNKNGVGMSPILCDHTLCDNASHEKYYEHSYLVSLLFAETFLLTIIFSKFFSTCIFRIKHCIYIHHIYYYYYYTDYWFWWRSHLLLWFPDPCCLQNRVRQLQVYYITGTITITIPCILKVRNHDSQECAENWTAHIKSQWYTQSCIMYLIYIHFTVARIPTGS